MICILGCQQFITQVSKVKNVMLPGAELKDLFTRMPKWPKKSKFINLQGCLNRDLFLVLWLLSEIFVSTVFCLKITLFMYQMTFSLNIFMSTVYYNFPNKKRSPFFPSLWGYFSRLTIYFKIFMQNSVWLHFQSICTFFIYEFFFNKKSRQVLAKYFEVYGQEDKIIPEAGKKGSFL